MLNPVDGEPYRFFVIQANCGHNVEVHPSGRNTDEPASGQQGEGVPTGKKRGRLVGGLEDGLSCSLAVE
jgi:hypothetical protein